MPKLSIIVPVYKAEKYLRQCIDSILAQTFIDWECVLVDDGSPDKSGEICDDYSQVDARINVLHKANGGVSSARNAGLDSVKGDWLTFVDADDCLYTKALEILVGQVERNNLDLIQCCFNREYLEGQVNPISTDVLSAEQYADSVQYLTCVWGTLFRRTIIENNSLHFDEAIKLGEDQIFLLNYMQYCSKTQRIGDVLYFYRNNGEGAVNNPKPEYEIASVRAFKELKRNNPIAKKRCDAMLLSWFVSLTLSSQTAVKEMDSLFKDVYLEYLSPRSHSVGKIAYYLMKVNIPLAVVLLRTIYRFK